MVHYHKNTEDMWILFIVRGGSKSSHLMHHNLHKTKQPTTTSNFRLTTEKRKCIMYIYLNYIKPNSISKMGNF